MDQTKKENLESHGWKFGDAADFLGITEDDFLMGITNIQLEAFQKGIDLNLVEKMCKDRGWNPLEVNEEMTVSFDRKKYKILRLS